MKTKTKHPNPKTGSAFAATLLTALSVVLAGCAPGFSGANSAGHKDNITECVGSACDPSPVPPTPTPNTPEWKDFSFQGSLSTNPLFGSSQVVRLDKENKMVLIQIPLLPLPELGQMKVKYPIDKISGAFLTVETSKEGRLTLVAHIPMGYFTRGLKQVAPGRLPNGDPLPAIPDGELPKVAIKLPFDNTSVSMYFSPGVFAIFVGTSKDPRIDLQIPIQDDRQVVMGYFNLIPAKMNFQGGFYLALKLPASVARIIDDNL